MSAQDAWSTFDVDDVARALSETRFHLAWSATTDSTNDDAAALLGEDAAAGRILAADY